MTGNGDFFKNAFRKDKNDEQNMRTDDIENNVDCNAADEGEVTEQVRDFMGGDFEDIPTPLEDMRTPAVPPPPPTPEDPNKDTTLRIRASALVENTNEQNAVFLNAKLGTINMGAIPTIQLDANIKSVPPLDVTGHIVGGDKPVKLDMDNLKIKELPTLRHELASPIYIPSSYKVSVTMQGSELASVTLKGTTILSPKPITADPAARSAANDNVNNDTK